MPDLFCPHCDYNLRGLESNRCPECGREFDREKLSRSQIPWSNRKQIGWVRAYWRTVWRVMFHNRQFCHEVARPVSHADAQRFRWVSILHSCVPLLLLIIAIYSFYGTRPFHKGQFDDYFEAVWPVAVAHVLLFLFLAAATGVPSYFFHPRSISTEQQNRAISISFYAAAPLAWTPFVLVILAVSPLVRNVDYRYGLYVIDIDNWVGGVQTFVAALIILGQIAYLWLLPAVMAKRTVGRSAAGMAMVLPLLWLVLFAGVVIGPPLAVGYVVLVIASLG